jgi:hypothetical protein
MIRFTMNRCEDVDLLCETYGGHINVKNLLPSVLFNEGIK